MTLSANQRQQVAAAALSALADFAAAGPDSVNAVTLAGVPLEAFAAQIATWARRLPTSDWDARLGVRDLGGELPGQLALTI